MLNFSYLKSDDLKNPQKQNVLDIFCVTAYKNDELLFLNFLLLNAN